MRKWAMWMFSVVTLVLLGGVGALIARAEYAPSPSFQERQARSLEDIARTLKRMESRCR